MDARTVAELEEVRAWLEADLLESKFKPTHVIQHNKRRIPVKVADGVCYTKAEWESETAADWEFDKKKGLRFQGKVPPGSSSIRKVGK